MDANKGAHLPPVIIGIAGGSGSGKTTVAHRVREAAPGKTVLIIHHDSYYHDNFRLPLEQRTRINYDHPDAFETSLLVAHLQALKRSDPVEVPTYDYAQHSRRLDTVRLEPADIVFVEGILVLEDERLREMMDIRLYVDVDADERFIRRLGRDTAERGRTVQAVIEQYLGVVRPMHLQFVEPSKRYADIVIPEGYNTGAVATVISMIRDVLRTR